MRFSWIMATNLVRRPSRTLLTILGLAVSIAATSALIAVGHGYAQSKLGYYQQRGIDMIVVRAGVAERVTSSLKGQLAARLREFPGVERVDVGLTEMVALGDSGLIGVPLRGMDPQGFSIAQLSIRDGRTLRPDDRRTILLGAGLATSLDQRVGDELDVEGTTFRVVGIYQGADEIESNTAAAPLQDVQELMDRPDKVSEIYLDVSDEVQSQEQWRDFKQRVEGLRDEQGQSLGFHAMTTQDFTASNTETKLLTAMALGTSLVAGGLAVVGTSNTMLMSVLERVAELALLRAVGWSRGRVVRLILGETLLLWGLAAVAGTLGAWLSLRIISQFPEARTLVPSSLPWYAWLAGTAIGLVCSVLGALYPAFWAASVPPVEAIRHE